MSHWLLKTEPETFSWDNQVEKGAAGEPWTGVRNHIAKRNLKAMKLAPGSYTLRIKVTDRKRGQSLPLSAQFTVT